MFLLNRWVCKTSEMGKLAIVAKRVAFVSYMLLIHGALVYLLLDKFVLQNMLRNDWKPDAVSDSNLQSSPLPTPEPEPTLPPPTPTPENANNYEASPVPIGRVIIPVQGVTRDKLIDTFSQSRSENRVHDAIDIAAPAGTPVLAAADGRIVKFHDSEKGGITIYQISSDQKYFFYYAHLQRRADGLAESQFVKTGTVIGYVGDTGNAGPGNYHLHFAISAVVDPKRFWDGININPYQILRGEAELR